MCAERKREAKLIVLSAPSGAGKSTLANMLLAKYSHFRLSISHTTRAPRGEEKNGQHYHFVNEAEFENMIRSGEFLEHARVFDKYWYGTGRKSVESVLNAGHPVLFDIDVQGAFSLKKAFGPRCITVFILPPSFEELESRLRGRKTDSSDAIEVRLKTAREELTQAPHFDFQITNNDLNASFQALEQILKTEGCL